MSDLTKKQKEVVIDLQNGWSLVTNNEVKGAWVSKSKADKEYHIDNGIFWRLVKKGLIYQQLSHPFNYVLTEQGKSIKL